MSQDQWNNNSAYPQNPAQYSSPDQTEQFDAQGNYQTAGQYGAPAYGYGTSQEAPQKQKSNTAKTAAVAALVAALVGGGVGAGVVYAGGQSSSASIATTTNAGTTIVNNTDSVNAVTAAAAKATPSVVTISVTSGSSSSGSGSGIVLDGEGHILTNTHVVTLDGEVSNPTVEVKFSNGTVKKAEVVGTDPTSDLAVIKVDPSGIELTPATLGDSSKLNVGDTAIAIGAPLGLENTVTDGIISNLNRTIEVASSAAPEEGSDSSSSQQSQNNPFGNSPFQFEMPGQQQSQTSVSSTISINVLQTDAAVNPGNSGGALVNSNGEVIGVNVAIASAGSSSSSSSQSGSIGVGFSIPIDYAKRIAQEIIDNGSATHGLLGASVSDSPANDDSSQVFADGAVIQQVVSGSGADKAGLKEGDVITKFGDKNVTAATELTAAVRQSAANEKVQVTYLRNGKEETAEVTLGNSADSSK